jgi:hypothetical protein
MIKIKLSKILETYLEQQDKEYICEVIYGIIQREYGEDIPICNAFRKQWCELVLGEHECYSFYMDRWNYRTGISVHEFEKETGFEYDADIIDIRYREYRIWVMERVMETIGDVEFQFGSVV